MLHWLLQSSQLLRGARQLACRNHIYEVPVT